MDNNVALLCSLAGCYRATLSETTIGEHDMLIANHPLTAIEICQPAVHVTSGLKSPVRVIGLNVYFIHL